MEEKFLLIEELAKDFVEADEETKIYVAGYIAGKMEERSKWQREKIA